MAVPKKTERFEMASDLEKADGLYRQGKYQEAYDLAVPRNEETDPEGYADACRIRAWSLYYLAIKGDPEEKETKAERAAGYARNVLSASKDLNRRLSASNVLPLVLWILGEEDEAWRASDRSLKEFPDDPSAENTRGILARWAKDYERAVLIGDGVTRKARAKGDFLIAGHGQQNKGDAWGALNCPDEAFDAYWQALGLYRCSHVPAHSHIASVLKKMLEIATISAE